MRSETLRVGGERIRYIRHGTGAPLLFLHGFGVPPRFYGDLLPKLSETYEVVAPRVCGINEFERQPQTVEELAELVDGFSRALGLGAHHAMGHSLGGYVQFLLAADGAPSTDIVAVNPLVPVDYGTYSFILRGTRVLSGARRRFEDALQQRRIPIYFVRNFLRDHDSSRALIDSISRVSYDGLDISRPTLILHSDRDEYFVMDRKTRKHVKRAFHEVHLRKVRGCHDWPIVSADRAVDLTRRFHHTLTEEFLDGKA